MENTAASRPGEPANVIVTATDFSAAAELAVERAARVALALDAELVVLHVFNDSAWHALGKVFDIASWRGRAPALLARDALSQRAADLSRRTGVRARAECLSGAAAEQIAAFAVGIGARLLVVGHRGENTLNEFVLGCTALKLVYNAEVPVLLVRTPATADYARVLVAIDRSDCSQRLAEAVPALFPTAGCTLFSAYAVPFESRLRLSGASDAEIDALRLAERERVETEMADFAARLDEAGAGHYEYRLARGFAATEILEETVEMRADLVAVGRHGGGRSEERLLGSVTQNVLYNARCDMLLMP